MSRLLRLCQESEDLLRALVAINEPEIVYDDALKSLADSLHEAIKQAKA